MNRTAQPSLAQPERQPTSFTFFAVLDRFAQPDCIVCTLKISNRATQSLPRLWERDSVPVSIGLGQWLFQELLSAVHANFA